MSQGTPSPDTGLIGLVMLARFHGVAASAEQLAHEFRHDGRPFGTAEILLAAGMLGLKARSVRCDRARLERQPLPALAVDLEGRYLILARATDGKVLVQRPGEERPLTLTDEEFQAAWSGELILVASRASIVSDLARFDFTWFIPAIMRYRKLLGEVVIVSIALQLFGLATPLFFQVVTDKVLVHRNLTTLDVVAFGLLVVVCFDAALTMLRGRRSFLAASVALSLGGCAGKAPPVARAVPSPLGQLRPISSGGAVSTGRSRPCLLA